MKEKFVYLLSLFVFLVIALLTIKQNDYLYGSQAVTVVPIIVVLILFCAVIIFVSKDIKRLDTSLYLLFYFHFLSNRIISLFFCASCQIPANFIFTLLCL